MSKKIVFKINMDGNVAIDSVEGYGSSCLDATSVVEKALGIASDTTRKMTEEYNEPVELDQSEHIEL